MRAHGIVRVPIGLGRLPAGTELDVQVLRLW
jgi:hypothetical protein